MGTVYEAVHVKSKEPVAVKVIAANLAQHQRFRRRFDAEIQTLIKLKHPNIVMLHEVLSDPSDSKVRARPVVDPRFRFPFMGLGCSFPFL
jgi:serine/threonine protein kinase